MHKATVWPIGFGESFVVLFVLNYRWRELLLSELTNRFDLRCESKANDVIVLQNLS